MHVQTTAVLFLVLKSVGKELVVHYVHKIPVPLLVRGTVGHQLAPLIVTLLVKQNVTTLVQILVRIQVVIGQEELHLEKVLN